MNRRVPIFDQLANEMTAGRHHVEAVVERLVDSAITDLQTIRSMEHTVPADLPSVLARLDAVVAAATDAKAAAAAEVVAEVEQRVVELEAEFGIAAPVDPTPVDPNAPQA